MKTKLPSKVFLELIRQADESRNLTILDVGSAMSDTVNFFAQYKCRLFFSDLFLEQVICDQHQEDIEQDLLGHFQALLDFPEGTKFDICLLWDFLNYLDTPALRAFSKALAPYLHADTRGHGFCLLNAKKSLLNENYGVLQEDILLTKPRQGEQLRVYPHSQSDLTKAGFCLNVSRSMLRTDGRVEMLLQAPG